MTSRAKLPGLAVAVALAGGLILILLVALATLPGGSARAEPPAQSTLLAPILTAQAQTASVPGTPTVEPNVKTVVRVEVDQTAKPIPRGQAFEARVQVENAEHLAGFAVTIEYDPKRLEPVLGAAGAPPDATSEATPIATTLKTRALGEFLASGGRGNALICDARSRAGNSVTMNCNLVGSPVCLGGAAGVSGSGLLGAVFFTSRGGGNTTLKLLSTTGLAPDDYSSCDASVVGTQSALPGDCLPFRQNPSASSTELSCKPDGTAAAVVGDPVEAGGQTWVQLEGLGWATTDHLEVQGDIPTIPIRLVDATVKLESTGGTSTLLIVLIAVLAVAVVAGGAGGYVWYRRRAAGAPPPSAT